MPSSYYSAVEATLAIILLLKCEYVVPIVDDIRPALMSHPGCDYCNHLS